MPAHVIHPIPLVIRGRPMSDSVYRPHESLGPISVIGVFVWYIEGPKENILIDCGMTWETYHRSGRTGYAHVQTLEEGLAKYGLKPTDIHLILQTHLHIDHIALGPCYKNAKIVVQQAELDYHRNPPPLTVDPGPCARQLLETLPWEPVKGDAPIVDGIRVLFTPGHTPGGQSIAVETAKGLAIIDGLDTTDSNWNIPAALQPRFEFFCPGIHSDQMQAYESLSRIKTLADIRVPTHEVRFAFIEKIPF